MNGFPSWTSWYGVHYVPDWAEGSACLIICHADALLSRIPIYCAIIVRSLNKECCPRRRHENNRLFLLFRKVTRGSCLAILVLLSNWENRTCSRALLLVFISNPRTVHCNTPYGKDRAQFSFKKKVETARSDEIACMIAMNILRMQHLPANYCSREKQSGWRDSQKIPKWIAQPCKMFCGREIFIFFIHMGRLIFF